MDVYGRGYGLSTVMGFDSGLKSFLVIALEQICSIGSY